MSNKYQNEKSRNENTNIEDDHQQTAEPSCLYEIKNISKDMINIIKTEMDSIDSNKMLQNLVQLLHSIHEEIRKKFANSQLLGKIEEIFDKNLELILNYFIRCFQHTDTVKISITNNVVNGLTNIQNSARILTEQYFNQEKINDFQKSSNFFLEEEFVKLINSLSTSIKEFMKNSTSVLKIINSNADSLSDQLSGSKNTINDLLNQINNSLLLQNSNQMKYSQKQGGTQPTTKDKIFKDKLSSLSDKIDILSSLKANLAKNLKFVDNYCSKFYDDSKGIFKQLKTLHTEKLSGLINQNQEFNQNAENLIAQSNNDNNMINNNNIKDGHINNRIEEQNENQDLDYNDGNNNVNYDDDNLFKFSNNNFEGRANNFYDGNSNTANNKFLNLNNLDQQGNFNNANIGVNDNNNNNNYIERENNFKNNSNNKQLTGSNLNNKPTGHSKNKSLNSHMNKSLNSGQMGNNFNLSNNLSNNLNAQNISPINKRHGSTNFNYNTNINDINNNVNREPRTNSNPKLTGKPFSKNSLLNNSVGKMNAINSNKNPSTPSNLTYYNNYMPHTTKQSNLNKSVGSLNRNKKKINNLSLGNTNNINGNGTLSEIETLMIQRNEELNNKINELLVEMKSLQVSYKKLTEENIALKNFNSSSTHGNHNLNQNTSASKVNAKSVKRTKSNENAFDNTKNATYIENANLFAMNNNNLCSKCQGMLLNPNSQGAFISKNKNSNLNSNTRKLSGDLNNFAMNSEPNENTNSISNNINNFNSNNNNYNNLSSSGNSFMNNNINNMNASASEKFYARKNYKEKLIELYTLSEKVIMFIELMQKLQEEISVKSGYVKELKILFEETKLELTKIANESYNRAKADLERELNSNCSLSNALDFSPGKMLINSSGNNVNKSSSKNLVNVNSKSKLNTKAGNKRNYNSTILNYVNKKFDSNNLSSSYNQNELTNISNNNTNNFNSCNYYNNFTSNNINSTNFNAVNTEDNSNLANSSFIPNNQNLNKSSAKNRNNNKKKNFINENLRNLTENNFNHQNISKLMQESQSAHTQLNNEDEAENQEEMQNNNNNIQRENYEIYEDENQNQMGKLNVELEENLKNLTAENNYLKELNENLIKEINELRELGQNIENENQEKANFIEELNEKITLMNQKLVDSVGEFENQQGENLNKIQEQESKINELLNELNITKLTNQALYAEINRRVNNNKSSNNEQEENEEDLVEGINHNNNNNNDDDENEDEKENENSKNIDTNNNKNNEKFVFNSLNNKDEDEKYILNMEIEKQISENIQSKQLLESLSNELVGIKSKYDSISKENKQIQEANKILKNELEKLNRELASKETNSAGKFNQKIKEIESLEKTIQDSKSIEKTDKAEIKKLNAKLNELDKQLTNSKNSLSETQIKLKVLKNEKDSLTDSLEKLKAEKTQNETKIREMQTKLDLYENQKNTLDMRYINLENDYNTLLNEAEKLRKEIDANSKANGDLAKKSENLLLEKSALEASNKKLIQEIAEIKNKFSFEKEKDEKNKNLIGKIEDLETELSKLNANLISKETEIKLLNKKNDELRSEIKSLSKASDNQALELSNSRKIEDNLKTEIKNLLKSEENQKAEIKSLNKKEENLNEEIKKIKSELDLFKENNKKLNSDLVEKTSKIDIQRKEIELLLSSKHELNAKVKSVIDNEGLLKLEIEKLLKLEEKLRHDVKDHVEKEHSLREQNKSLLQAEEKLKADINSLTKENENYKEIYNSNAKNEEEKVSALKNKMSELESENKKLKEKDEIKKAEIENLIRLNENFKKEKEEFDSKLKEADKAYKALNQEKDNFRAEAENLKVLTEDYDSKCERISELENKYRKLKQEKNNLNNEEIEKLNKLISENTQRIKTLQDENTKLLKENTELGSEIISNKNQSQNTIEINTEKDKKYGELETEKDQLLEKLKQVSQELETERENKTKLKSLNETQLNYLLKFSDKFLEINNNALDSIENLNSKFTQADYVYQIPILDILHEINFSELKETFQRIRSNNIAESYNAIINFFSSFFEAKVLKIPETINQNIINIETKFAKVYEDWQAKLPSYSKIEKDLKNANEKVKNSEIEKVNLATLLDGKEQECDQLTYKLADVEKKYKNFRESQKNNSQIHESKIENLDKENKKLLEALSNLQAELELVLDENEKLKNEKDQLGNLENIGFGNFMNSNNLLDNLKNENTISNRDVGNGDENNNHNNNLIIVNNDFDNEFNRDSFSHRKSNPIVPQETATDANCSKPADPILRPKMIKTLSLTDENITSEAPKNQVKSKYENAFNFRNNNNSNNNINKYTNPTFNNNDIYFNNENYNNGENTNNLNSNNNNNSNYKKENELQQKLIYLEKKYTELFEDNKKLKLIFDECTQTIYDAIKHYSPNLFEDENNEAGEASEKLGGNQANQNLLTINNIPDSRGSVNSNYSFSTDRDLISKAVEMFKRYNKEINEKIKKLDEKNNELDMNSRTYKIMADEYKNAWELALKKSDKIQFDSLAAQHPPEIGELSERLKTDLANFTVEDLIEAGHIVLDENGNISARNNLDAVNNNHKNQNMIKKLSGRNLNLLGDFETAIPAGRKNNNNNNNREERENTEFKSFNLGGNLLELNIDSFAEGEENNEESKNKAAEEETKKFNYAAYLEKFNNPAEYKILAFKKLSNDLVWYLLIPKNASNSAGNDNNNSNNKKANFENKFESNFAKNTSNISDLDFMMINKIRKKSSNKLNNFSSIEKDSGRKNNNSYNNGLNVLIKNYDYYMWVPGKIIASNLTNFEFEKNLADAPNEVAAPNKERIVTQTSICEKCEMKQKELNVNFEHLNELEKKYTSMLDEKDAEIKQLEKIQENLMQKLSTKEEEIIKFSSQNNLEFNNNNNSLNSNEKTVSLEKYETLLNEFREEQDKGYELMKVYEELKRDYDNMTKKLFNLQNENNIKVNRSGKSPNNNKVPYALDTENMQKDAMDKSFNNKTTNEIKDLNDVEVGDLLEMHNRNSLGGMNDLKELAKKINNFNTVPTGENNKSALNATHNNLNLNTDGNDFTLNMNKTEGYYTHDNVKEAVSDYEKNEQLLMDQLMEIKDELKQTRNERDLFKKKYNDSITLQDGKKDEILNMLRSAVEKLIIEIQLTPKIKELLTVILKICDFDDDHIALIFKDKEQKKKSFFGFMNKK